MNILEHYLQLDNIILTETNIKVLIRHLIKTEQGDVQLHCDGTRYFFMLNGKDVTTPKLLETVPGILAQCCY